MMARWSPSPSGYISHQPKANRLARHVRLRIPPQCSFILGFTVGSSKLSSKKKKKSFKEMPFQACTRRSTVLLAALSLVVASSLHGASGHFALREAADDDDVDYSRRLSGGGEDKSKTIPFNSWSSAIDTLQYVLAFVVVLVAAHPLGLFFPKLFKLPLITGYLVIGIIAGPLSRIFCQRGSSPCCRAT